jgi:hypothetical protein
VASISVLLALQSRKAEHSASLSLHVLLINKTTAPTDPTPTRDFSDDALELFMSFSTL